MLDEIRVTKVAHLLEFPFAVVQRAHLTRLEPSRNAVEVESVLHDDRALTNMKYEEIFSATHVADSPGNGAFFARCRSLVRLALDAEIHDVVSANGTVVDDDVWRWEGMEVSRSLGTV